MKYTAGGLRKMNGRKCKLQYKDMPRAEGEIYVVNGEVNFVTDNYLYSGAGKIKPGYSYSLLIFYASDNSEHTHLDFPLIIFLDEHQNIYHDDNGEIIKEGDLVFVGDNKEKRIFLCKVPRINTYICIGEMDVYTSSRTTCIKYKEPEKKLRELMLTDSEYEEVKNRYK